MPSQASARGMRAHEFGKKAELLVIKDLKADGWKVTPQGDKGTATDLIARKGSHTRYVQVKGTEGPGPRWPDADGISRLLRTAHRHGGTPVVAQVYSPNGDGKFKIDYRSAERRSLLR